MPASRHNDNSASGSTVCGEDLDHTALCPYSLQPPLFPLCRDYKRIDMSIQYVFLMIYVQRMGRGNPLRLPCSPPMILRCPCNDGRIGRAIIAGSGDVRPPPMNGWVTRATARDCPYHPSCHSPISSQSWRVALITPHGAIPHCTGRHGPCTVTPTLPCPIVPCSPATITDG